MTVQLPSPDDGVLCLSGVPISKNCGFAGGGSPGGGGMLDFFGGGDQRVCVVPTGAGNFGACQVSVLRGGFFGEVHEMVEESGGPAGVDGIGCFVHISICGSIMSTRFGVDE